jgi:hypothetical protein
MLNVPELRDKFHAARHSDSEIAYLGRKWVVKLLDELEMYQKSASAMAIDNETFQSVIAAQEAERRGKTEHTALLNKVPKELREAALSASYDLMGIQDQRATNLMLADSLLTNVDAWNRDRTKVRNLRVRAELDRFHGTGQSICPTCNQVRENKA